MQIRVGRNETDAGELWMFPAGYHRSRDPQNQNDDGGERGAFPPVGCDAESVDEERACEIDSTCIRRRGRSQVRRVAIAWNRSM